MFSKQFRELFDKVFGTPFYLLSVIGRLGLLGFLIFILLIARSVKLYSLA